MKRGEITRIAKEVGITPTYMALIIKNRKVPSPPIAEKLEKVTGVDRRAWLYPNQFDNPMIPRAEASTSAVNQ